MKKIKSLVFLILILISIINLSYGAYQATCAGSMSFDNTTQKVRCGNDIFRFGNFEIGDKESGLFSNEIDAEYIGSSRGKESKKHTLVTKSGRYLCIKESIFILKYKEKVTGYCDIIGSNNNSPSQDCTLDGTNVNEAQSKSFYKFKKVPYGKSCDVLSNKQPRSCSNGVLEGNSDFLYSSCIVEDKWSKGIDLDYSSITWEIKDEYTIRKIKYDVNNEKFKYLNKNKEFESLSIPSVENPNQIKIHKNSNLIRSDDISKIQIALNGHKIKKLNTKQDAQKYFDNTYNLMSKLQIQKHTIFDGTRTNIKINLTSVNKKNIAIYEVIDKDITPDISNIMFYPSEHFSSFIVDKDPVIGWYFNESYQDGIVEYSLPDESEGGVLIITQEPVLQNNGELIVNYREVECHSDEAFLFELDDLFDSKLYVPNSNKLYKVCLAHRKFNLNTHSLQNPFIKVFNYKDNGNMSFNMDFLEKVEINAQNLTPVYWDLKIQENSPIGNYSCLGSFNPNSPSSLFGDCDYNPTSRIWIHLGADYIKPTTTFSYPTLSHTLRISFQSNDDALGSGIASTYYCLKDETNSCQDKNNFILYDNKEVLVTCPEKWGCERDLFYYSKDNFGNVEDTNHAKLSLIELGSACNENCIVSPAPNRYMESCNNLNNCNYYDYNNNNIFDDGKYVATLCHYSVMDAWVNFNLTHEIKCPNGPFRKSLYSNSTIDLRSSSCENIKITNRNTILNGETVIMKIISCDD